MTAPDEFRCHSGTIPAESGDSGPIPADSGDSGAIPADSGAIPPESGHSCRNPWGTEKYTDKPLTHVADVEKSVTGQKTVTSGLTFTI